MHMYVALSTCNKVNKKMINKIALTMLLLNIVPVFANAKEKCLPLAKQYLGTSYSFNVGEGREVTGKKKAKFIFQKIDENNYKAFTVNSSFDVTKNCNQITFQMPYRIDTIPPTTGFGTCNGFINKNRTINISCTINTILTTGEPYEDEIIIKMRPKQ